MKSIVNHEGILLTLQDGTQYLVHIVPNMKPVLVNAKEMSSNWQVRQSKAVNTTVAKVMKVAEDMGNYSLLFNNCIHVATKIYNSF